MQDTLLDTSWTLHYISTNSKSYRVLFISPPPSQVQLQKYANQLTQYLATHTPQYTDDLNDERDKLGILKECKWGCVHLASSSTTIKPCAISITLHYQTQTFKFVLYSPSLILTKSPPTHIMRLFDFLNTIFSISIDTLKLPSSLLSNGLSSYITSIHSPPSRHNNTTTNNHIQSSLLPQSHLRTAIGTLKLTISFTAPTITPQLRTIDLDIPFETVESLIRDESQTIPPPTPPPSSSHPTNTPGSKFLSNLSHYITSQTGLKLPLCFYSSSPSSTTTNTNTNTNSTTVMEPMRLSRITCSAFAISVEGKLKFSSKAVENDDVGGGGGGEDDGVVGMANGLLLGMIEREALERGEGGG